MYVDQNHSRCYAIVMYRQMACLWQLLLPYNIVADGKPLIITLQPITFISVNDSTLFEDGIFVLWSHKEVLDGQASFKGNLYPMFTASFLKVLSQPFVVRNHHVRVLVVIVVVSRIVGASSVVFLCWGFGLDLHPVESPCRVLAFCKYFK